MADGYITRCVSSVSVLYFRRRYDGWSHPVHDRVLS